MCIWFILHGSWLTSQNLGNVLSNKSNGITSFYSIWSFLSS